MVRKAIMVIMVVLVTLFVAGTASAGSSINLDEITKNVPIGGTVDFTVTLQTSNTGPGVIAWRIESGDPITAKLESEPLDKFGYITVTTPPSSQPFTLTVKAGDGAVVGQEYLVRLSYCTGTGPCEGNTARARAEAGAIPTPELSTSILTATGLIGLIGLVRMKRKD